MARIKIIKWEYSLFSINSDLDFLLRYIELLKTNLDSARISLDSEIEIKFKVHMEKYNNFDDIESYKKEMHRSKLVEVNHLIPKMIWHSVFVSLISSLEYHMVDLAQRHYDKSKRKLALPLSSWLANNLKKVESIDDSFKYWKDIGNDKPKKSDKLWNQIENYRALRHLIIHAAGEIDKHPNPQKIRNYLNTKNKNLVYLDSDSSHNRNVLIITPEFCCEAIETIRSYFKGFVLSLPQASELDSP